MSWSTGEIMNATSSDRVTLQNNFFSEALRNSTHADDRNGDNDQDGYTNLEEFLNGTSP